MTEAESKETLDRAELKRLFDAGNYRALRAQAMTLREQALAQDDQDALREIDALVDRTRPDPTGAKIYLLAFVVLVIVTALTYSGAFE